MHAGQAFDHAVKAGLMLIEAKRQVGHGKWEKWLEANVKVGIRQAQNYMNVATCPEEKRNAVAHLSLRKAIEHLARKKKVKRSATIETYDDDGKLIERRAMAKEELDGAEFTSPCGLVYPVGKHAGKTFDELNPVAGEEPEEPEEDDWEEIVINQSKIIGAIADRLVWDLKEGKLDFTGKLIRVVKQTVESWSKLAAFLEDKEP